MNSLTCFKPYDIRGQLSTELDEDIAYKIGRAFVEVLSPKKVVLGGDMRLSSESLKLSLCNAIRDAGADVIDIGMVGTELVYFATSFLDADGGIQVTASHNPIDYNGMKLVGNGAKPISSATGLLKIKELAEKNEFTATGNIEKGNYKKVDLLDDYIKHIVGYIEYKKIKPLKILVNAGNGSAGPVVNAFENFFSTHNVPIKMIKINNTPDGTFPNGIPNPILKENRNSTIEAVIENKADLGIAWDGDFDRCFLVDENGRFIEGYYIVGLLAKVFLQKDPGSKIVHDPRLTWNTIDVVKKYGGQAIQSRTGHAFMKEKMRQENAVYGGEMSAHHYFRDFFYCDSGMIPWLLIIEQMCKSGLQLSKMVDEMIQKYPSPGEINFKVKDPDLAILRVRDFYQSTASVIDETDGISMEFDTWRFNIRMSNTEPLVRVNIETKSDQKCLTACVERITFLLTEKHN